MTVEQLQRENETWKRAFNEIAAERLALMDEVADLRKQLEAAREWAQVRATINKPRKS